MIHCDVGDLIISVQMICPDEALKRTLAKDVPKGIDFRFGVEKGT